MAHAESTPDALRPDGRVRQRRRRWSTAATKARLAGYRKMDAYSPIPIEELNEALGLKRTRLPLLVLLGGIVGGLGGFTPASTGRRRSPIR